VIRLEHVHKVFGNSVAVEDLSLDIQAGEVFAFLGPNGAGKTTTIKMVAGLLRPTRGRVEVCGYDVVTQYVEAKRRMAYVPDQPFLYDKLSGAEFLRFVGGMYGLNGPFLRSETERLVDLFAMNAWIRQLTETYSHGMKQRLVLAAMLLHKPDVIVVDEPLVGLDPRTAKQVRGIFLEEARRGATLFLTTHVLSIAEESAHRIGIILQGRLRAVGTMEELRREAQTDGRLEDVFFRITGEGNGAAGDSESGREGETPGSHRG